MCYLKNQWSIFLSVLVILGFTNQIPAQPSPDGLVFSGQYHSALTSRADFHQFWEAVLTQMAKWPAQVTRNDESHELQFQGHSGRWCPGAISVPTGGTVTAAILHIVEKGNRQRHLSWQDGYGHLCINWYPADQEQQWNPQGLPDRQAYILAEAIMDAARAAEVLLSQPEVLADRVGIIGEGVGGGIALALAALMPEKVSFVIAYDPWPAYHYPPSGLIPQSPQVAGALASYADEYPQWRQAMRRSTSYFDIINFAGEIDAPTLIVMPYLAQYSGPSPAMIIYNHLRCDKQLLFTSPHGQARSSPKATCKQVCHQWAQRALVSAHRAQTRSTAAFDDLAVPEPRWTQVENRLGAGQAN